MDKKTEVGGRRAEAVRTPSSFSLAWQAWITSDEGKACVCPTSIGAAMKQERYMSNRLWRAFSAGYRANERTEFAEIVERLKQRGVIQMDFDAAKLEEVAARENAVVDHLAAIGLDREVKHA